MICRNRRSYTIIELVFSVVIATAMVTLGYNLYIFAQRTWLSAFVQGELERTASIGLEKMIRGVDENRKGIQEAKDITVPVTGSSDTQITFVDQLSDETNMISRRFYLDGSSLVYEDEDGNTSNLIDDYVETLVFNRLQDDLVEINLRLERTIAGREVRAELDSKVKLRNR